MSEAALLEVRHRLEQAISSAELPGIELLLVDGVAIPGPTGGERVPQAEAARWLREHAGPGLRLSQFDRHHHAALLVAEVEGWPRMPPINNGRLGLTFHLYDSAGRQDDSAGSWKIDAIIVQ